jgi:hypothetical protein
MIHFIDLRHANIEGVRFAFFDAEACSFVPDSIGRQAWDTIGAFVAAMPEGTLHEYASLVPEWSKYARSEIEVFKVARVQEANALPHVRVTNEDGTATGSFPFAPVIAAALRGRDVAYFEGEQTFETDGASGAIEGEILVDFNSEVEGPTW